MLPASVCSCVHRTTGIACKLSLALLLCTPARFTRRANDGGTIPISYNTANFIVWARSSSSNSTLAYHGKARYGEQAAGYQRISVTETSAVRCLCAPMLPAVLPAVFPHGPEARWLSCCHHLHDSCQSSSTHC